VANSWFRMDVNYPTHDKVMRLASEGKYRAIVAHTSALGYAHGHDTDGFIAAHVIALIHARPAEMSALVEVGLVEPVDGGWQIRNFAKRNPKSTGSKANCVRWHGPDCGCWEVPK